MTTLADVDSKADLTPRERQATAAASRQGLDLRRCDDARGARSSRYDLVSERFNRPVATNLELLAVEGWLGIGETRRPD